MSDTSAPASSVRLHDIDALRAFAMLLGIGLHAALAYGGTPWLAVDPTQDEFFRWFFEAVHGFRMHLFFFVSGFFTMLLWRRRGLNSLLIQRFQRVGVPFLLGFFLLVPAMQWVTVWSAENVPDQLPTQTFGKSELVEAIRKRDTAAVQRLVGSGADVDKADPQFGIPPLSWAALLDEVDSARMLLDAGADVNVRARDGTRPLHSAMFLGRPRVVELLLQRGADPEAIGGRGETPRDVANTDTRITFVLATRVGVSAFDLFNVRNRRKECLAILDQYLEQQGQNWLHPVRDQVKKWRAQYREWISSSRWQVKLSFTGPKVHLILSPQFAHLWFLWDLCWFLLFFALAIMVIWYLPLPRWFGYLILPRFRLLWLIPLTMLPQMFMGAFANTIGPDTAIGVIPMPHLLAFYGIFFFAGAAYYDSNDEQRRLGRWWFLWLPLAAWAFWQAKQTLGDVVVSGFWQVLYAWAMIFGLMGFFYQILSREYRLVRYLSDASYWLYLTHLPLVVMVQAYIRGWDYSPWQKFLIVCGTVTGSLLIVYHFLVRPTYIGVILNGPRRKKEPSASKPAAEDAPSSTPTRPEVSAPQAV